MSVPASVAEPERAAEGSPQLVDYRIVDDGFVARRWFLGVVAGAIGSIYLAFALGFGIMVAADDASLLAPAAFTVILTCTTVYTWFVTRIFRRVTVGKDGVSFRRGCGLDSTFVSFAELEGVEDPGRFRPLADLRTLDLRMHGGSTFTIGAGTPDRVVIVVGAISRGPAGVARRGGADDRARGPPQGRAAHRRLGRRTAQASGRRSCVPGHDVPLRGARSGGLESLGLAGPAPRGRRRSRGTWRRGGEGAGAQRRA